jgi:chromosome segregation ATPase
LVVPSDPEALTQAAYEERIRAANLDFLGRVGDTLSLPIQVLIEQRDGALAELARQGASAQVEMQRVSAEHERFVAFLMEEQLSNLRHVRDQLDAAKEELQRYRALAAAAPVIARPAEPVSQPAEPSEAAAGAVSTEGALVRQVESLRAELEAAFAEIDETRAEAARLQEERDDAIRQSDDVRAELQGEIDAARDDTFEVQSKLDSVIRELDDVRDEARDQAMGLTEEIDDLRRSLDERTEEVRRLRARLGNSSDEVQHSRPPPPGPATELDAARREIKWLRQQLIEAKRQASKGAVKEVPRPKGYKPTRGLDGRPSASKSEGRDSSPGGDGALQPPKVPDLG